jgi:arylsulfatase A-like enzyme
MLRPNIVVVLVDQMRRDAMGWAGDENVRTPNLDLMAQRGLRFSAACSSFPACVPFRFSFMTGEYAHSRNVPALGHRLSPAERTLGEALKEQGYATAYIGKWHLYSAYGVSGGLTLSQACRMPIPATHRRGFDHWEGFELRNDFEDTWYFRNDEVRPRRLPGHQTDGLFDLALRYLEGRQSAAKPFFMLLSVEAPHPPFMASEESLARVRARGGLVLQPNVDLAGIRFFPPEWYEEAGPAGRIDPADPASVARVFEANMQAYYAMIEMIDANMGRLGETLRHCGLDRSTIVVFLSDHGELGGSHGQLGKAEPWEESVGIPLIVEGPPELIPGGRETDVPVSSEDFFHTLLGLAGSEAEPPPPRANLGPFIRGEAGPPQRDGVLLEFVTETRANRAYYDETWRGIRTRTHKYLIKGDRRGALPWLLFDLEADPYEMTNMLGRPGSEEIAADLHAALLRLLDAAGDDFAVAEAHGWPARNAVPR